MCHLGWQKVIVLQLICSLQVRLEQMKGCNLVFIFNLWILFLCLSVFCNS